MKYALVIFLLSLFFRGNAQWVDSRDGKCPGYQAMIDSTSSLTTLIQRLEGNWEFDEPDKAYWIGYAREMYSIAAKKDSAVQPLLTFIDTSKNDHAISGAIYTLHLIGINSRIAGRFIEEFTNVKARVALLSLLKNPDYQPIIIELLIRDRHATDIPMIFEAMLATDSDCWALNNYLTCFNLPIPINQDLWIGVYGDFVEIEYTEALKANSQLQLPVILTQIEKKHFDNIIVDSSLLTRDLYWTKRSFFGYGQAFGKVNVYVVDFLNAFTSESYTNIGSHIQYYIENKKLHICTQATAKARLIDWWLCMSPEERRLACEKK